MEGRPPLFTASVAEKQRGAAKPSSRTELCNHGGRHRISFFRNGATTMRFQLITTALASVLICSAAGAQVRSASSNEPRPAVRVTAAPGATANTTARSASGLRSAQQANVIQISPSGPFISGFGSPANTFGFDSVPRVPGLGFDYPHLVAVSGALHNNSRHFRHAHFDHDGFRGQGSFVPIWFGGYPYFGYDDTGYDQQQSAQQPQPQIIVIQQPVPWQQEAESRNDEVISSSTAADSQPAKPIRDVGDFIIVRRDGRVLFASIYSVVGSQLQYVTPEGIRHAVPMSDLDVDATRQMNEARGTTVQIQN